MRSLVSFSPLPSSLVTISLTPLFAHAASKAPSQRVLCRSRYQGTTCRVSGALPNGLSLLPAARFVMRLTFLSRTHSPMDSTNPDLRHAGSANGPATRPRPSGPCASIWGPTYPGDVRAPRRDREHAHPQLRQDIPDSIINSERGGSPAVKGDLP